MNKTIQTTIILTALLLSSCSNSISSAKNNEATESTRLVLAEDPEATKTSETFETFEPVDTTVGTTGHWIDSNLNFSHDPDDFYYVNDLQVSMKEYYEQLEQNDELKAFDSYSTLNSFRYALDKAKNGFESSGHYITEKKVEFLSSGQDGPIVTGTIPQITGDSEDVKRVNEEIEKIAMDNPDWDMGGSPYTKYITIERHGDGEDGSWTLLWFFAANKDQFVIKPYTFDVNWRLMTSDEILASAGCDGSFTDKVEKKLERDLDLATVYYECNMEGLNTEVTKESLRSSPDVFINQDGIPVMILKLQGDFRTLLWSDMPYPCEFSYNTSDKLITTDESDRYKELFEQDDLKDESIASGILNGLVRGESDIYSRDPVSIRDIDVNNPPDENDQGPRSYGSVFVNCYGVNEDNAFCKLALDGISSTDGDYRFELYSEGKAVAEGVIHKKADPYYKTIEIKCPIKKEGEYLLVIYDRNSDEWVLASCWFNNISRSWGE